MVPRVIAPTGLLVLGDPVSGERSLGVEKLFDVVQDQALQRAADERDVDLADAGQPQLAACVGLGEEVLAAEAARAVRNRRRVGALSPVVVVVVAIEMLLAGDDHVDGHDGARDRREVRPR